MTEETQTPEGNTPGPRPRFRAWLVQDGPDGKPVWTELGGLWPTRKGAGYSGSLKVPLAAIAGRIVVLPATAAPASDAAAGGAA